MLFEQCYQPASDNMKDLDQNMLDIGMYHSNLGIHLRQGDADYSSWLLTGMDSCLQVVAAHFDAHRKLTSPFKRAYQKQLRPPVKNIRKALKQHDFPSAINAYRILTDKCNGCHIDNDINKEVFDLSDPSYNEPSY